MATQVYIDQRVFMITTEPSLLRDHEHYQSVKDAINSRTRFLLGTVPWEEVYEKCTLLGASIGVDFLMATYYTVASLKIRGLKSYANGLELMLQCYLQDLKHDGLVSKNKKDIIDWMVGQVIDELKVTKPDKTALRDLYRCERALQELHELCTRYQPEFLPNIETAAFILFEYIDSFDTALVTKNDRHFDVHNVSDKAQPPRKKQGVLKWTLIWGTVCGLAVFGFWYAQQQLQSEKLMALMSDQMNTSVLSDHHKWQEAQPVIKHFLSQNTQKQAWFQVQYERLNAQRATQRTQFKKELERFYLARTNAANVTKQILQMDPKSISAKGLDNYILGLSPIYARLDYIDQLLNKGDNQQAEKELVILDERLSRVINDVVDKQTVLMNRADEKADRFIP